MTEPRVSFVMGTYNCREYIEAALDSLTSQTYKNWDVVICDDGSSDGTYEYLQEVAAAWGTKMTLLRNSTNKTLGFTLNRCLDRAAGDFIARMDGDDISAPERLKRQVKFLTSREDVDAVGTAMQRFSGDSMADVVFAPLHPAPATLKRGVPFNHATVLARRKVFEEVRYSTDPSTQRCEDLDLWFRFFSQGFRGANLSDTLYFVREDRNAIRRRNVRTRWNVFRTTLSGYQLMGFPRHAYLLPMLDLLKALAPTPLVATYRAYQSWTFRHRTQPFPVDPGQGDSSARKSP